MCVIEEWRIIRWKIIDQLSHIVYRSNEIPPLNELPVDVVRRAVLASFVDRRFRGALHSDYILLTRMG